MTKAEMINEIITQEMETIEWWLREGKRDKLQGYLRSLLGLENLTEEELRERYSDYFPQESS